MIRRERRRRRSATQGRDPAILYSLAVKTAFNAATVGTIYLIAEAIV
ncbi:hypothetical protein [Erythrobacter sp.]|nr:hypothetical protein [Erythrobacter sp.]QIQ86932.1 MAG: hypothetical protein G9473_09715 [Erythrobacter sp.]